MADRFDAATVVRRRIAEETERRTGFLDLSELGLEGLPEELFALTHLRRLHLGAELAERDGAWTLTGKRGPRNAVAADLGRLAALPRLEALAVSGTDCSDLGPISALSGLT